MLKPAGDSDLLHKRFRRHCHLHAGFFRPRRSVSFSDAPGTLYSRTGPPVHHIFHDYVRTEVMIPMRDGVKLHAVILRPADIATPLPILMERTPYGVDETSRASFFAQRPELARDGYIYVGEDIRGRYKSQGKFVMMRPLADHRNPNAIDESTDAYDTVAWLIKNVPGNNGRVGVVGTSYPGFLAMMAGIDPHPAVKAISPQAPMIDVWIGDDFFHNGAFRQSYGYDYVLSMESSKEETERRLRQRQGRPSRGRLRLLSRARQLCRGREAVRRQAAAHLEALPRSSCIRLRLVVARRGVRAQHRRRAHAYRRRLLRPGRYVGPAGGVRKAGAARYAVTRTFSFSGRGGTGTWSSSSQHLGNLDYGEPIGKEFRARIEAKFFAHYLKDAPGFDLEDTASFQTGSNTWQYYSHFPPPQSTPTSLYLAGNGLLSWSAATSRCAHAATSAIPPIRFPTATGPSSPRTRTAPSGTTGSPKTSAS